MTVYPYIWRVKKWLPERFGQRCRIVARAGRGRNARLIEFDDGTRVVASGNYLRRADAATDGGRDMTLDEAIKELLVYANDSLRVRQRGDTAVWAKLDAARERCREYLERKEGAT